MEKQLDKYIKEKHTQEECVGFIDGFKAAEKSFRQGVVAGATVGAVVGAIVSTIVFSILIFY